ncbi:GNAT family N-acetyltransferase [Cellulomonas fengjieae]|uniref:GNAT family N-acetyltransferase n=1 Tax=Cellulomonas fengjieae TaxID=2819978 RepID=A0ABS3SC13_9CELL|nr:GNAT family N-acetyltransferase [Cellulomonas fengjieae]MBO3083283.1 GNAT family N-acetyltransferase [Cellulomonas fengjieae]QVI65367.1 GNAT family N-acetyltransferase [Cellulomonas fengjieae]
MTTTTTIELVGWDDPDAARLRTAQQAELRDLYGDDDIGHAMTGETIVAMLLLRADGEAVACGAIRDASDELGEGVGELKRMYVLPAHRGRGHSRAVLRELERLAEQKGFRRLVLETGVLQASAIGLYLSEGYRSIPNFGQYAAEAESRCFAKDLGGTTQRPPRTGERPTVTLTRTHWDDPVATALRLAMWHDIEVRYPELVARTPGGFAADDPQQGVGALSTVIAWLDGRPVGCATLRAARDGYPAGSGELKKVWVDDDARGSGAARALLAAVEDDARAHGLTSVVLQTGIRQPEAVSLYLSAGYRPVVPFFDPTGDFLSLWMAKDL